MNSEFEKRLQQQPMRELPREWRSEILQSAKSNSGALERGVASQPRDFLSTLHQQLSSILWPCPKAWAGLAAVWMVLAIFNFTTSEPRREAVEITRVATPMTIMAWRNQEQLLAGVEKSLPPEPQPVEPRKYFVPRPRSELSNRFKTT